MSEPSRTTGATQPLEEKEVGEDVLSHDTLAAETGHPRPRFQREIRFAAAALLSLVILVTVLIFNKSRDKTGKAPPVALIDSSATNPASDPTPRAPGQPPAAEGGSRDVSPPPPPAPAATVANDDVPPEKDVQVAMTDGVKSPSEETPKPEKKEKEKAKPEPVDVPAPATTEGPAGSDPPRKPADEPQAPLPPPGTEKPVAPIDAQAEGPEPVSPPPSPAIDKPETGDGAAVEMPLMSPPEQPRSEPKPERGPSETPTSQGAGANPNPGPANPPMPTPAEPLPDIEPPASTTSAPAGTKTPELPEAAVASPEADPIPATDTPRSTAVPGPTPPSATATASPATPEPTTPTPEPGPAPEPAPAPPTETKPSAGSRTISLPNNFSPEAGPAPQPASLPSLTSTPGPTPEPPNPAPKAAETTETGASTRAATGAEKWVTLPSAGKGQSLDGFDRAAPRPVSVRTPVREPRVSDRPAGDPDGGGQVETLLHVVQRDENFWTISRLYYGSGRFWKALWAANRGLVPDPKVLYINQTIRIPPPEELDRSLIELERAPRPARTNLVSSARPVAAPDRVEIDLPVSDPFARREPEREPETSPIRRSPYMIYEVRPDETLRSIARDILGDSRRSDEILELNPNVIDDPYHLVPGQRLKLPEDARVGRGR